MRTPADFFSIRDITSRGLRVPQVSAMTIILHSAIMSHNTKCTPPNTEDRQTKQKKVKLKKVKQQTVEVAADAGCSDNAKRVQQTDINVTGSNIMKWSQAIVNAKLLRPIALEVHTQTALQTEYENRAPTDTVFAL